MSVYGTKQTYFVDVVMSAIDPKRNTIATCAGRAVYGWSRTELFAEVERAFWRHNAIVSGMLLALMVAIGSYMHLRGELLAGGLPLLALGTALSTYLGFMITRGLRWIEIVLGSAVMLTLMAVSLLLGQELVNLGLVFSIEVLLLGVVFVLRAVALRRWSRIDWFECRPPKVLITRQA